MKKKIVGIFVCLLFIISFFPTATAYESYHEVYGYLYINDFIAPAGILIQLTGPSGDEETETISTGYYELSFYGHDNELCLFYVLYIYNWYIPIDNSSVYILENTSYNIDLHISIPQPHYVYVDDDFDQSTPGWGYDHFDNIQDGISAVNESNGNVYVYNGSYYENVIIDKSINIVGEDKNSTIIDGSNSGNTVHITADWVNFSNFKIQNGGGHPLFVGLRLESDHNTISNNKISSNNVDGVWIYNSNYNTIKNNFISSNGDDALVFYVSNHSKVIDNIIDSNDDNGIIIYHPSNDIKILGNIVSKNSDNGIYTDSSSNIISRNNISENEVGVYFYGSSNNIVTKNNILDNKDDGIYLNEYSDNNDINNNTITNNWYALRLWKSSNNIVHQNIFSETLYYAVSLSQSSLNNQLYHNNFLENTNNAWDESPPNSWDNNYPSGGNYWDDYMGEDSDGNGIGDSNYTIIPYNSVDRYPLVNPWGENLPIANFTYNAETSPVYFDGSSSYDRDGDIVLYEWDFGDGSIGHGKKVYHRYCEVGIYNVTLTVIDNTGLIGIISKNVEIGTGNTLPQIEIFGPENGRPGNEYEYVFIITDADDNESHLWIEWGDNISTGWQGPFKNGESLKFTHSWTEDGTYVIRAKAKDSCNESDWFNFQVIIPRNWMFIKSLLQMLFEQFPLLDRIQIFLKVI